MLSIFRNYQRELVCAHCHGLVAWVGLRPFRHPSVKHVTGPAVFPMREHMARAVTRTRLARAMETSRDPLFAGDPELPDAIDRGRRQLDYLGRSLGEPVYELLCGGCGRQYLRSMPHLSRMVRRAPTGRVPLR